MNENRPIIIFDGVCELCNSSVDFILRKEKRPDFLFTANQHEMGRRLLAEHGLDPDDVSTIYLLENGKLHARSGAVLRIARRLKWPWRWAWGFMLVPWFLRDAVYRFVAKRRYRWFGKKDTCRVVSPEERERFLID
ncbi:MAG: DCC1-like thiol-disulfide oxidoreductase family protein [Bacteroidota bacterium]